MPAAMLTSAKESLGRRQSGVIPYRLVSGSLEVMLITNRSGRHLLVPKGAVERAMTAVESAQKEAFEEAGVVGKPHRHAIGSIMGSRSGKRCLIDLWPMRVTVVHAVYPEMALRRRLWLPAHDAALRVGREDLAELILQLAERLHRARAAA